MNLKQFYCLLHYQSSIVHVINTIYTRVKNVTVKTAYSRETWVYALVLASVPPRRCFDVRNKIMYCISTKFGTYKHNEEKTRCIDFRERESKVKIKKCKYEDIFINIA